MGKNAKIEYNFKCKGCGHKLTQDGKAYGTNWIFFMCLVKDGGKGCNNGSVWIDVKNRVDNNGHHYKKT